MTATLSERIELDQSTRSRGGLLASSKNLPAGWERGVSVPFYGCSEPELSDGCAFADDVPLPDPAVGAEFKPLEIRQGSISSTLCGGLDVEDQALSRLNATSEYALGRQLATNDAGFADQPSFADAVSMGTVADANFVHAVSCLEQAAADAGFGAEWVLHGPVRAAAYLRRDYLLDDNGRGPLGEQWIFSTGYPVQGATTIRLWATGTVWANVSQPGPLHADDLSVRRQNSELVYTDRAGLAVFDPCILISIDVTVPACS